MQQLQKSERPHIAFFGCTNSGKSSLVNAITNQQLSVVSDIKGTTTDPVSKSMELLPLGPVVIIDTAGIDDEGNKTVYDLAEGSTDNNTDCHIKNVTSGNELLEGLEKGFFSSGHDEKFLSKIYF